MPSLVGSEMCIRDSYDLVDRGARMSTHDSAGGESLTGNTSASAPGDTDRPAKRTSAKSPTGPEDVGPRADKRSERLVATCFGVSSLAAIAFLVVFWALPKTDVAYTPLLGVCLAVSLFGVGVGAILWAKKIMPDEEAVQERHAMYSLSLIHISEPTRLGMISYAVFCLKKKK